MASQDTAQQRVGKKRSLAWIYYGILTVLAVGAGFLSPSAFLVAIPFAAYTTYLYRGGRWVLWIW